MRNCYRRNNLFFTGC